MDLVMKMEEKGRTGFQEDEESQLGDLGQIETDMWP